MFERASKKLGLDQAVLDGMTKLRKLFFIMLTLNRTSEISKVESKELNSLLRKGVYAMMNGNDDDISKFCEEDIDQILEARTTKVTYSLARGSGGGG